MIAKLDQRLPFTTPSAVIHGLWTHPKARNGVTIQAALLQVLHDAAAISGNQSVFAVIQKNDPETVLAVKHCGGIERTH